MIRITTLLSLSDNTCFCFHTTGDNIPVAPEKQITTVDKNGVVARQSVEYCRILMGADIFFAVFKKCSLTRIARSSSSAESSYKR